MVAAFSAELGEPASGRADGKRPFARWKADGGTSVMASAEVAREGRVRVAVVHEKLPDAAATGPAKEAARPHPGPPLVGWRQRGRSRPGG